MSSKRLEEIKSKLSNFAATVWDISEDDYMWLVGQAECVEESENRYDEQLEESQKTYDYFKEEIKQLREALEWYADEEKYYYQPSQVDEDFGEVAREALGRETK